MALKKDRGSKTESLSLRLDPKTKFLLEFVGRINGQTLTTVVERAIRTSCDQVGIPAVAGGPKCNWQYFWDIEEGIRTLKLLGSPHYPTNSEEEQLKDFVGSHHEFFFRSVNNLDPQRTYVQLLWPKVETYLQIWDNKRQSDYWAAGNAMVQDLRAAKVQPPQWPREGEYTAEDIPF
jgi:hypothetical protein